MSRATNLPPFLQGTPPLAFAHRGGARLWPENTLSAFRAAVDLGYRYIETDLHTTRDGVIVTLHDDTLERTTDGRGPVWETTAEELKRLDAGYHFSPDGETFPFRGRGLTVPALAELTDLTPDLRVNVEVKQKAPAMVEALWRFIEERGLHDRILVASFRDAVVREFRRLSGGRVATSAATREALRFWLASRLGLERLLRIEYDALQVPVSYDRFKVVDRRFLAAAHRRGLQVHVWTVDDPAEIRRLLDLGVDGIMSDRPDLLKDVLVERGAWR